MRYLVTLKPLEPYMFGGEMTFGALGDKEAGSYLVRSRSFPQQTAVLGMLRKTLMTQAGLLTRKRRGEWVDKEKKAEAAALVGTEKFDMLSSDVQDLGIIHEISAVFLINNGKRFVKKANIDEYPYENGILRGYDPKEDIHDHYVSPDGASACKSDDIFLCVEQTGNKKGGEENSLFKKSTYLLKDDFRFAFYLDMEGELQEDIVSLGADGSAFLMSVTLSSESLRCPAEKDHLVLLSDAYITEDIRRHATFALVSEISHRNLKNKKTATKKYRTVLEKSETLYLYEKGTVFIEPDQRLIDDLNKANLQKIGYNTYSIGEK
jgi:CRISPR-associated protein Cmr3